MSIRDLMRADLVALAPYETPDVEGARQSGRAVVKLDSNENPYGPSPNVAAALAASPVEWYPDAECTELRLELSGFLGTDPERIVCSNGGDEMLDLLLRLFVNDGDEVIDLTPSFVMYELTTTYNHGTLVPVPRIQDEGFAVDVPAVLDAVSDRTKVIFLCNPNNPTGNLTPLGDIIRVLETGRIVVVDEAYSEFSGITVMDLAPRYPNLVIMRTMSKWAALAGLRLGYAVVDPSVRQEMLKIKSPYNVGIAAQVSGIVSLRDRKYLMGNVYRIVEERDRLFRSLQAFGRGTVYPSKTNFLYWTTGGIDAGALKSAMARRGVLIRAFHQPIEALRFSVGTPEQSDALMAALEESYAELAG